MNSSITNIKINNSPHLIQSTTTNGVSISFQIDSKQLDLYKEISNNNVNKETPIAKKENK